MVSKATHIILWLEKCSSMLQFVLGKSAVAVLHIDGSGEPDLISSGTEVRAKFHIRIPAARHSIAYTCEFESGC